MAISNDPRKDELASFLKQARARLRPQDLGLPGGQRRRVPGLRREEVAELAGISATWYAWLEQGRAVNYSAATLESLADALRLDVSEREYVFTLAGHLPPSVELPHAVMSPALRQLVEAMGSHPVLVHRRSWDLLHWNDSAAALFGLVGCGPEGSPNLLWQLFTNPGYRELFVEWERFARCALSHYRAEAHLFPEHEEMVRRLLLVSPEFREIWPRHDVRKPRDWSSLPLRGPTGPLLLDSCEMQVTHQPGVFVTVFTPVDSITADRLAELGK